MVSLARLKEWKSFREKKRKLQEKQLQEMLNQGLLEWKRTRHGWVLKERKVYNATMIFGGILALAGIGLAFVNPLAGLILAACGAITIALDAIFD